jgi:hypothetical protein
MSAIHQLLLSVGSAPATAAITYVSSNSNESNLTTYTFSAQSIGTAAADRFVIVGCYAPRNTSTCTITDVTIGGITATQLVQSKDASAFSDFAIYGASVPTGTTADVVVTLSAAPDRFGIDVFAATALSSTTPTATQTDNTASVNLSKSITVQANGFILGCSGNENTAATHTWTNLTERLDQATGTGGSSQTSASDVYSTGQSVTVTQSPSAAQSRQALLLIAMR